MITDARYRFTGASGQTITSATTTTSTDVVALFDATDNAIQDIGVGTDIYLVAVLTGGSVTTVTSPTATINLQTDESDSFGSATQVFTSGAIALPTTTAAAAAGDVLVAAKLPSADYEKYLRAQIVTGGTITTASYTFQVFLTLDIDKWRAYANRRTIQ